MKSKAILIILLPLLVRSSVGAAQPAATPPAAEGSTCYYLDGPAAGDRFEFEPSDAIQKSVQDIVEASGLTPRRFTVKSANVPNAAAEIAGSERKVLYSARFINQLESATGSKWAAISVLAHEVAHHLDGHTLKLDEQRPRLELEADRFSGFVVCKLGGTEQDAASALANFGGDTQPGYPPLSARLEAVAAGWRMAIERGLCPDTARTGMVTSDRLTPFTHAVVITPENAASILSRPVVTGATILFENVQLEVNTLILHAEKIHFDERSVLRGRDISLIAKEIEGGLIDTSGAPGSPGAEGGKVLLAALRLVGTVVSARGGSGTPGSPGSDGRDGRPGSNGSNGRCGPGITGQFSGSTEGSSGENGIDGGNGGPGGNGGNGGEIVLLTFQQGAVSLDINPGDGGAGGPGGRGGRGGPGGRGGAGCSGLGGTQPDRSSGADGREGRNGLPGPAGQKGRPGRVWSQPISGIEVLRDALKDGDLNRAVSKLRGYATQL